MCVYALNAIFLQIYDAMYFYQKNRIPFLLSDIRIVRRLQGQPSTALHHLYIF